MNVTTNLDQRSVCEENMSENGFPKVLDNFKDCFKDIFKDYLEDCLDDCLEYMEHWAKFLKI